MNANARAGNLEDIRFTSSANQYLTDGTLDTRTSVRKSIEKLMIHVSGVHFTRLLHMPVTLYFYYNYESQQSILTEIYHVDLCDKLKKMLSSPISFRMFLQLFVTWLKHLFCVLMRNPLE